MDIYCDYWNIFIYYIRQQSGFDLFRTGNETHCWYNEKRQIVKDTNTIKKGEQQNKLKIDKSQFDFFFWKGKKSLYSCICRMKETNALSTWEL